MERSRRKKLVIIFVLFACVASLSIGFAAFSTTLNISSSASVSPNSDTFSVKFSISQAKLDDSDVVPSSKTNGITATNGVINNSFNPMISNLSAQFTAPGQYVEYTFYARNEGEYTAYLNSVNFIGEKLCEKIGDATESLVSSACDYINISVDVSGNTYLETTEISGHTLSKKSGEQIKVRLEYDEEGTAVDGEIKITFNEIMLVYSTIDDSSFMPPTVDDDTGDSEVTVNYEDTLHFKLVSLSLGTDVNIDFNKCDVTEKGVFLNNESINSSYPIYYYRGAVIDNNLLFANKCWKILRTTEKGGVKILYNGTPTSDNKCLGNDSTIGDSWFNTTPYVMGSGDSYYINADGSDSEVKAFVDAWYKENLISYTNKLEDAGWCHDMSTDISTDSSTDHLFDKYFNILEQLSPPTFSCPSKFLLKVSAASTSARLKYPISLLSGDEAIFAGNNFCSSSFLTNGVGWWTLSPSTFDVVDGSIEMIYVRDSGDLDWNGGDYSVRPVISLNLNTRLVSGNGTSETPYIVE